MMKSLRNRGTILLGIMGRLAAVVTLSLFVHVQMGGTLGVPGGTGAAAASTARTVYFPPLTGHDMIEFLDKNADRLRVTLADYDGLYAFSKSVGDRPLIQAMRRNLTAEETAAEEAPKVSKAPETP